MKKNSPLRSPIFLKWVLSYMVLLLIQVIIGTGIYFFSSSSIKEEVLRSNTIFLNHIKKAGDEIFSDVDSAFADLIVESNLNKFNNMDFLDQPKLQYEIKRLQVTLNAIMNRSENISYIMIYFKELGMVLTQNSFMTSDKYYTEYYIDKSLSLNDWDWYMRKKYHRYYSPNTFRSELESGGEDADLAFKHSYPQNSNADSGTTIVIGILNGIDPDIIEELSDSLVFLIINGEDEVVSTNRPDFDADPLINRMVINGDLRFDIGIKGETYIVNTIHSNVNDLRYVAAVPEQLFWKKLIYIRNLTWISLGALLLVGALFAYAFTLRNYNPVRGLVDNIGNGSHDYPVAHLQSDYRHDSRNQILLKMLNGTIDVRRLEETGLKGFDSLKKSKELLLALVRVERGNREEVNLSHVMGKFEESMEDKLLLDSVVFSDELFGYIFNNPGESLLETFDQIRNALTHAKSSLSREEGIELTISISGSHMGVNGLTLCYDEAMKALLYKKIAGSENVISYSQLKNMSNLYHYSLEDQQNLIGLIRKGNVEESEELIDDLFDINFRKRLISVEVGMCFIFDILGTFYKLCHTHGDLAIISSLRPVSRIGQCDTMEEIHEEIVSLVRDLCSHYEQTLSIDRIIERVEAIVKQSFHDSQLYVAAIADQVKFSPNYLSKIYKKQRGHSLLFFIHKTRLEEAKKLLTADSHVLNDIALMTGFSDSNALIRVFKKYEGISPGKYKKMHNADNSINP